jgi:hypothetical protein
MRAGRSVEALNRDLAEETVETVNVTSGRSGTPLKRGVNER